MIDGANPETTVKGGEPDLENIYRRMRRRVFRMFGYRNDLEDIVQAAMEKFVKARSSFRGEGSIEGFADAVAANVARTWMYKHRRASFVHAMFTETEEWPKLDEGPAEEVDRTDKIRRLLEILEGLKPAYRIPIVMYYIEGRSVAEIARTEGITDNAAYTRLARGRKQIHKRAGKDPVLAEMIAGWRESK
jgi:RNA polymerase sigma-70 factor (ECF subfamily)